MMTGLNRSYERMLVKKASLGQNLVITDEQGQPKTIPAAEALEKYLRERG